MKSVVVVLAILGSALGSRFISTDQIETLFKKAFKNELCQNETETLGDLLQILRRPEPISTKSMDYNSEIRTTLDCIVCKSVFASLFDSVKSGQSDEQLIPTLAFLCTTLNIESDQVCKGVIKLNLPILNHIIRTTPAATPGAFCALILQDGNKPDNAACPLTDPRFEWQVELPPASSAVVPPTRTSNEAPLNVVLITDFHLDPKYEAGGVANCDAPTCCRKGQKPKRKSRLLQLPTIDESIIKDNMMIRDGKLSLDLDLVCKTKGIRSPIRGRYSQRDETPAGYWGDYRKCDTPIWAFDETIDTISETQKNIDLVYYIGDTIDHGVWETTYKLVKDMNTYTVEKLRTTFGDRVLVLPAIGNHDSQPTNQFAPTRVTGEKLNTTWVYNAIASKWSHYLTEEAQATMRERGGYSMLVKPGLRVISINNNVAYRYNWWLVYDPLEAKKHLDWLIEELYKAEQAGEKVHLLIHIPPGLNDLLYTWTREYNRVINRFSLTIKAEFNGHTHSDEFKIFYNDKREAINMAWGVGGVNTYSNYNLNYKVAAFDAENYAPTSIVNYVYNLTEANLTPNRRPHWFQLYDMTNTFKLDDLSANSMDNLVTSMVTTNREYLELYNAYFSKLNDVQWSQCRNSNDCKLNNLCKTVITVLWDRWRCEELINLFYSTQQMAHQLGIPISN